MHTPFFSISHIWRFLDHSTFGPTFDTLNSFAYDDTFCTLIGKEKASHALIRTWVHHDTIVLGIQDSRLPYIEEGRAFLESQGYRVIVRNSGGLAVLLDDGILNMSIIVKEEKGFSIDAGYELMYDLIKKMFSSFNMNIEAYEIVGSYCPGSYDLSINGKKFAGISQRRIRGGVSIQIYLCVHGSGSKRAQLIRTFYERATKGEQTKFTYPLIVPNRMASLSELFHKPISISDVIQRLLLTLQNDGVRLVSEPLTEEELELFSGQYKRIADRNKRFLN